MNLILWFGWEVDVNLTTVVSNNVTGCKISVSQQLVLIYASRHGEQIGKYEQ